jgi:uncharacterized protein
VTGASYGIGEAFARQLAQRGLDLLLVARSGERLEQLKTELGSAHCEVLACDLTERLPSTEELGRVDLLVNNAGFGHFGRFEAQKPAAMLKMLDLNVRALTGLVQIVLPQMLGRSRGGILNVASNAGFQPLPYMAGYAATKAYVISLSQALAAEYRSRGVTVTALCPGYTVTRFHQVAGNPELSPGLAQSPEEVVAAGLKAMEAGRSTVVSGWYNQVGAVLGKLAPGPLAATIAARFFKPYE